MRILENRAPKNPRTRHDVRFHIQGGGAVRHKDVPMDAVWSKILTNRVPTLLLIKQEAQLMLTTRSTLLG